MNTKYLIGIYQISKQNTYIVVHISPNIPMNNKYLIGIYL